MSSPWYRVDVKWEDGVESFGGYPHGNWKAAHRWARHLARVRGKVAESVRIENYVPDFTSLFRLEVMLINANTGSPYWCPLEWLGINPSGGCCPELRGYVTQKAAIEALAVWTLGGPAHSINTRIVAYKRPLDVQR